MVTSGKVAAPKKRKVMQLSFDASLYPWPALKGAAAAFHELARITIKKQGARVLVKMDPQAAAPTDEILSGEFGNYALGLACETKRRARSAKTGR